MALAITCAGCGRISFAPLTDAPVDLAPLGPFGTPHQIGELADPAEDDDPTLPDDRLEIFWETTRLGGFKIMRASRTTIGAPWSAPELVTDLASLSPYNEACPEISSDGLTMLFSSDRPGGSGGQDLYISTRATRTSAWSMPERIPELESGNDDYCAIIAPSELEIFFHSDRATPGARDLYRAVRPNLTAPWDPPIPITELNTAGDDESAFPMPGGLDLWFASNGGGNRDLFQTSRTAVGALFATPALPISEIDTPADESDAWISRDGHTLVFASNRDGNSEIYEASR